jgi:hypothetical protein
MEHEENGVPKGTAHRSGPAQLPLDALENTIGTTPKSPMSALALSGA